mmetsp:Transcript_125247/g.365810  ORF Transcript_125247/g.365810 Transcript_125247/m.365810 type:complete len:337 (-) Transcript_125247:127-1137(-)
MSTFFCGGRATAASFANVTGSSRRWSTCWMAQTGTTVVCCCAMGAATLAKSPVGRSTEATVLSCSCRAADPQLNAGEGGRSSPLLDASMALPSAASASSSVPSSRFLAGRLDTSGELFALHGRHRSLGSSMVRNVFFTSTPATSSPTSGAGPSATGSLSSSSPSLSVPVRSGCVRAFGGKSKGGSSSKVRKVFLTRRESLLLCALGGCAGAGRKASTIGQLFCFLTTFASATTGSCSSSSKSLHVAVKFGWVLALGGKLGDSSSSIVKKVFFTLSLMSRSSVIGEPLWEGVCCDKGSSAMSQVGKDDPVGWAGPTCLNHSGLWSEARSPLRSSSRL